MFNENDILDISHITKHELNYANQRNISFFKLFQARPLGELREAIDLFRTLHYHLAIVMLVDNILAKQVSQDYYHMALCYIARSFARMGDSKNAELVMLETQKVRLPAHYLHSASMLVEDMITDIENSRISTD